MKSTVRIKILLGIFVPFFIVFGALSAYMIHITSRYISSIVIATTALTAVLLVLFFVTKSVAGPLQKLTLAAEAISEGNLETEIPLYFKSRYTIGSLSYSLHRMVEQFHFNIIRLEQTQAMSAVHSQIDIAVRESNSIGHLFRSVLYILRQQSHFYRMAAVYVDEDGLYALLGHETEDHEMCINEAATFSSHAEVLSHLDGKKLLFFNLHALKYQNISYLDKKTVFAIIIPLYFEAEIRGYIILETRDKYTCFGIKEDEILVYIAEQLSNCIMVNHTRRQAEPADILCSLRDIKGLNVDVALEAMGGLKDIYEQSVRLFARLAPDTVRRMDQYLEDNRKAFSIEVHGIRGSLHNIGATELGNMAAYIENAVKACDIKVFKESYQSFRGLLMDFHRKLINVLELESTGKKQSGDVSILTERLGKIKDAVENFDSLEAKERMKEIADFSFNPEIDSTIEEIIIALDSFDCEKAIALIEKLEDMEGVL